MDKDIRFEIIKRNSRGRRYAVLINDDIDICDMEKVIISLNKLWGGYETYLIPYSDKGIDSIFLKMLRDMDPDYITVWDNAKVEDWILDLIGKYSSPFTSNNNIISKVFKIRDNEIKFSYPHVETKEILKYRNNNIKEIRNIAKNKIEERDWGYLSLLSLVGYIDTNNTNIAINELSKDELFNMASELSLAPKRLKNIYNNNIYFPYDISMYGLNKWQYTSSDLFLNGQNCYIIVGNTIKDFAYFFNMSRYNSYTFFVDSTSNPNINKNDLYFLEYLWDEFKYYEEKCIKLIYSDDVVQNSEQLKKIERLLLENFTTITIDKINLNEAFFSRPFEIYNYKGESERIIFNGNKALDEISGQIFKDHEDMMADNFRWISEVEFENYDGIINKNIRYRNSFSQSKSIRFSRMGIAFESIKELIYIDMEIGQALKKIMVYHNDLGTNLRDILKSKNYTYTTSNQGKYSTNVLSKFNYDIEELAEVLKDTAYQKVFSKYIQEPNNNLKNNNFKNVGRRNYLSYNNISNLIDNAKKTKEVINTLINKKILHRGFLIKCNECSNAFWVSLDNIGDYIQCNQCFETMFYNYSLSDFGEESFEPTIYYKLDEVFYKAWKNNFHVPIITLEYLKSTCKTNFNYLTEIELYDNDNLYCEIDFICVCDKKLMIGECKINGEIDDRQIKKYGHIASMIGVDRILFCTLMDKFNAKTMARIAEHRHDLMNKFGIDIEVIKNEELLY